MSRAMPNEAMTAGQAWRDVRNRFRGADIDTAALDARLLAQHVLGLDGAGLVLAEKTPICGHKLQALQDLAARRLSGEPIARILGEKEFFGLAFGVNAETLVPRPETELVVERGLTLLAKTSAPRLLDLGTGTGCIVIALLHHLENARAVAVDVSAKALEQARHNASRHDVEGRISFCRGSWFEPVGDEERFDLIVSNPPYIAQEVIGRLQREVREHDPHLALDGGRDGLDPYRAIASSALKHLSEDGAVVVEIGHDQARAVRGLLAEAGFGKTEVHCDLSGLDRVVVARR